MKKFLLVFAAFAISYSALTQKELKKADSFFASREYKEAAEQYKLAAPKIKDLDVKAKAYYNVGECYRLMTKFNEAIEYYDMAGRAMYGKKEPLLHYNWGLCLTMQGKYEDAVNQFKKFLDNGGDREKGNQAIKNAQSAADLKNTKSKIVVDLVPELSTPEFDFALNFAAKKSPKDGDQFVLASSRKSSMGSNFDSKTGEDFMDLFRVTRDPKGKFGTPEPLAALNTQHNEGPVSYSKDFGDVYFTFCQYEEGEYHPCEIRMSKIQNDKYEPAVKVVFDKTNGDSIVFGHPCLSQDGKTLFFASNLKGGKGGMDIWYSQYDKKADAWGAPKNLSAVNTNGDEMFPWTDDKNILYFASNTLPGLGGFDIFKSTKGEEMNFAAPVNIGYPINSTSDDFALIIDRSAEKLYKVEFAGFFTSNRPGGKGKDDIYQFRDVPVLFTMKGFVYDDKTGNPVENASVVVKGTDGSEYKLSSDASGAFSLDNTQVLAENTYSVSIEKKDYIGIPNDRFSTRNIKSNTDFAKEYFITPIIIGEEYHMPLVQYPFNKTDLLIKTEGTDTIVNSPDSLNYLFKLLTKNPTWRIRLEAHTDARGSDEANQTLSDGRAKTCVDYLVSKGVNAMRMVPVGKGEKQPITLKKSQGNLKAGDILTEEYIGKLTTEEDKELAHQLNRRTVFVITGTDFDPKNPTPSAVDGAKSDPKGAPKANGKDSGKNTDPKGGNKPAPKKP
jgi:peptidoglycan-associated lipoprotein